jgi:26S proteasome regulatory subunit N11
VIDQALRIVCNGLARSQHGDSIEVSGLLLGREIGAGLFITSAVSGKQVSTQYGSELDENFIAAIAHQVATGKREDRIVGMFHSHPGIGIFMSRQDVRTLMNFQRLHPAFVMMVIDPLTRVRYRFFRYDTETGTARPFPAELIP